MRDEQCDAPLESNDSPDCFEGVAVVGEFTNPSGDFDVAVAIQAHPAVGACGLHQPMPLVFAKRLRVHLGKLGGPSDRMTSNVDCRAVMGCMALLWS